MSDDSVPPHDGAAYSPFVPLVGNVSDRIRQRIGVGLHCLGDSEAVVKLKQEDIWFSRCVRQRALWTCECCRKQYDQSSSGLHCSHFYGRRKRSVRWHPLNAAAHCYSCHQRLGSNPIQFAEWIQSHLGNGEYHRLVVLQNAIGKFTANDRRAIAAHYRREYERMQDASATELVGRYPRIEFEAAPVIVEKIERLAA